MPDRYSRKVAEVIRRAVEEARLPATLEALSPENLARVEALAARLGIEPLAALHRARHAQKAAIAEARATEKLALAAGKARR